VQTLHRRWIAGPSAGRTGADTCLLCGVRWTLSGEPSGDARVAKGSRSRDRRNTWTQARRPGRMEAIG
jgi:hypothetical protein